MSERYDRLTKQLGTRFVELTQNLQERQVSAAKSIRERIKNVAPRLAEIELPLVDVLPSPRAITRANFALAEVILDAQKSYALGVLDAFAPSRKPAKPKAVKSED